ncbi:unnamed protein product [Lota lota]
MIRASPLPALCGDSVVRRQCCAATALCGDGVVRRQRCAAARVDANTRLALRSSFDPSPSFNTRDQTTSLSQSHKAKQPRDGRMSLS